MRIADLVARVRAEGIEATENGLRRVREGLHNVADTARRAGQEVRQNVNSAFSQMHDISLRAATSMGGLVAIFSGLTGVAGVAGLGSAAFQAAVRMDQLTRGLATTAVSADDLRGQLSSLQQVAALPGLNLEQAVQGAARLEVVGLSARLAERSLSAFGNAVASAGGGAAEIEGITIALTQAVGKGQLFAEELAQISERAPVIRAVLQDVFGTADTEKLAKLNIPVEQMIERIVTGLEKLPRVTGGVANDIENFADRAQRALLPLGQGLIVALQTLSPYVERILSNLERRMTDIGETIAAISRSGLVERFLNPLLDAFGLLTTTGDSVVAMMARINGGTASASDQLEFLRQQVHAVDGSFESLAQSNSGPSAFVTGLMNGVATVSAVLLNLPTAFQQVKGYFHDVFTTIKADVSEVGKWFENVYNAIDVNTGLLVFQLGERWKWLFATMQNEFKDYIAQWTPWLKFVSEVQGGGVVGQKNWIGRMADSIVEYSATKKAVPEITPFAFFPTPTFQDLGRQLKPLPGFPNIDLLAGRQSIFDSIQAAYRPLDLVPEGLTYGGRSKSGPASHVETLLGQIEGHTRRSANALDPTSLRRQAIGTGPLSAMGVTPAELSGGSAFGRMRAQGIRGSYGGDDLMRQMVNAFNALAERKARELLRRQTGSGFSNR